jgi:hypothetical protein
MAFLAREHILNPEFVSGIKLLNLQEDSKTELIFSRLIEHEARIRSEPEPTLTSESAFTDEEKPKLISLLTGVESLDQVQPSFQ